MPQIFRPRSNKIALLSLILFCVSLLLMAVSAYAYFHSSSFFEVGAFREQPIPFNHKQHVQGLGLDCRFCHSAVENSRTAGMPSTEVCMSCHSQILSSSPIIEPIIKSLTHKRPIIWTRVNSLADHVYFNHSIHVNKGVSCQSCHGNVQEMAQITKVKPLTMQWCLECHTHSEKPNDKTRLTNCYECHR